VNAALAFLHNLSHATLLLRFSGVQKTGSSIPAHTLEEGEFTFHDPCTRFHCLRRRLSRDADTLLAHKPALAPMTAYSQ